MGTDPVMCPGCGSAMVMAVSRGATGREYVCDSCGSAMAGIAVLRALLGDGVAGKIWTGIDPADGTVAGVAKRCGFCFSAMSPRSVENGTAAICRICQVMWLDKAALESLATPTSPVRLAQVGVARCGNCGAGIPSPLDHKCRHCGSAFTIEPVVAAAPVRRRSHVNSDVMEVAGLFARAVGAVLDWYPFS